jgi:hypothetical protein
MLAEHGAQYHFPCKQYVLINNKKQDSKTIFPRAFAA